VLSHLPSQLLRLSLNWRLRRSDNGCDTDIATVDVIDLSPLDLICLLTVAMRYEEYADIRVFTR